MALLSDAERNTALRELVRRAFVEIGERADFDTDTLRVAINEIDDFLEANSTAINNAFSQPFRNAASPSLKALVVAFVALKRSGVL